MHYELSCRDLGMGDRFVARGQTKSEVMKKMAVHGKKFHHMSDKELKDSGMKRMMKNSIHRVK
jgi:predicted small metal-binding protein